MWIYEKQLQYPVKIDRPNPRLAGLIITALGGPDGEAGAAMRYLNQRYTMPDGRVIGILTECCCARNNLLCKVSKFESLGSLLCKAHVVKSLALLSKSI